MATRRERVVLDLQDNFTAGMVKAAGAARGLDMALHGLDGSSTNVNRSLSSSAVETDRVSTSARKADASINQLTGRLRLLADVAAILGPSLVPIGAVAVPAVTGLASQLGFAALGAGSLVTAFHGVGDALKAVNDAALDPTAANLEKAQAAMAQLGPDAQAFVTRFQELRPVLRDIRDSAAAGWFPGLTESMDSFERIAPQVADLFENIGRVGGDLIAEGMANFADPGWDSFREMIGTEAPRMLDDLGRTVGNLIAGMAHLWEAFTPLNQDFSAWLLDASRSFEQWADGLSRTEGFNEFVDYIRTNGPKVADALKAVGDAVLQIIEAVAPLGGPSLKIIETFANAIAAIADSDLGTPIFGAVAALAAYNRMMQATIGLQARLGFAGAGSAAAGAGGMVGFLGGGRTGSLSAATRDLRTYGALRTQVLARTTAETQRMNDALARSKAGFSSVARGAGPAALAIGMIGASTTDAGSALVSTNTAMGTMMGSMAGPWGALAGGIVGSMLDITAASKQMTAALESGSQSSANAIISQRTDWTNPAAWTGAKSDMLDITKGYLGGIDLSNPSSLMGPDAFDNAKAGYKTDDLIKQAGAWKQFGESIPAAELGKMNNEMKRAGGISNWLADQVQQSTDAMLGAFSAETSWRQAMVAANKQARTNDAGIKGRSEAALANRQALEGLAAAWNNQSDAVKENSTRQRQAEKAFVDTAVAMGVPIKRARELAAAILDIPESHKTVLRAQDDASAKIHGVIGLLSSVKDKTVHITTVFERKNIGMDRATNHATGGLITGPGTTTSDSIPAWLSNKEYVIKAAAVEKYGVSFFDRANAMQLATGGPVGRPPVSQMRPLAPAWPSYPPSLSVDLEPLRAEIRAVRDEVRANTADRGTQTDKQIKQSRYGASAAARSWTRGGS